MKYKSIDSIVETIRKNRIENEDKMILHAVGNFLISNSLSLEQFCSGYITELRHYQDQRYADVIMRKRRKYERKQYVLKEHIKKKLDI